MYGERIITGQSERQYYNCRRAYAWLKDHMKKGYLLYYKITPDSCRLKPIYKITLKGNSLWVITAKTNFALDGLPLVVKDKEGKVVDTYQWIAKPYPYKGSISKEIIQSKKVWIEYRLGSGELRCYPEASITPFVITNVKEDENGIYSTNRAGTKKVYLNAYYIFYTDKDGNVDVHRNK